MKVELDEKSQFPPVVPGFLSYGETTTEPYHYVKPVGNGAQAFVWLVRRARDGKYFAVKIKKTTIEDIGKKEKELDWLEQVKHFSCLRIFESLYAKPYLFILTEYCESGSLHFLKKNSYLLVARSISFIALQLLAGLQYLHSSLNIVHCDIKPENVFADSCNFVKIGDFGLSSSIHQIESSSIASEDSKENWKTCSSSSYPSSKPLKIGGTLQYIAPEILQHQPHSPASDMWSLGLLLAECLTGKRVLEVSTAKDYVEKVFKQPFVSMRKWYHATLSSNDPHVPIINPEDLPILDVIDSLLQKDPSKRPTSTELLRTVFFQSVGRRFLDALDPHSPSIIDDSKRQIRMEVYAALEQQLGLGSSCVRRGSGVKGILDPSSDSGDGGGRNGSLHSGLSTVSPSVPKKIRIHANFSFKMRASSPNIQGIGSTASLQSFCGSPLSHSPPSNDVSFCSLMGTNYDPVSVDSSGNMVMPLGSCTLAGPHRNADYRPSPFFPSSPEKRVKRIIEMTSNYLIFSSEIHLLACSILSSQNKVGEVVPEDIPHDEKEGTCNGNAAMPIRGSRKKRSTRGAASTVGEGYPGSGHRCDMNWLRKIPFHDRSSLRDTAKGVKEVESLSPSGKLGQHEKYGKEETSRKDNAPSPFLVSSSLTSSHLHGNNALSLRGKGLGVVPDPSDSRAVSSPLIHSPFLMPSDDDFMDNISHSSHSSGVSLSSPALPQLSVCSGFEEDVLLAEKVVEDRGEQGKVPANNSDEKHLLRTDKKNSEITFMSFSHDVEDVMVDTAMRPFPSANDEDGVLQNIPLWPGERRERIGELEITLPLRKAKSAVNYHKGGMWRDFDLAVFSKTSDPVVRQSIRSRSTPCYSLSNERRWQLLHRKPKSRGEPLVSIFPPPVCAVPTGVMKPITRMKGKRAEASLIESRCSLVEKKKEHEDACSQDESNLEQENAKMLKTSVELRCLSWSEKETAIETDGCSSASRSAKSLSHLDRARFLSLPPPSLKEGKEKYFRNKRLMRSCCTLHSSSERSRSHSDHLHPSSTPFRRKISESVERLSASPALSSFSHHPDSVLIGEIKQKTNSSESLPSGSLIAFHRFYADYQHVKFRHGSEKCFTLLVEENEVEVVEDVQKKGKHPPLISFFSVVENGMRLPVAKRVPPHSPFHTPMHVNPLTATTSSTTVTGVAAGATGGGVIINANGPTVNPVAPLQLFFISVPPIAARAQSVYAVSEYTNTNPNNNNSHFFVPPTPSASVEASIGKNNVFQPFSNCISPPHCRDTGSPVSCRPHGRQNAPSKPSSPYPNFVPSPTVGRIETCPSISHSVLSVLSSASPTPFQPPHSVNIPFVSSPHPQGQVSDCSRSPSHNLFLASPTCISTVQCPQNNNGNIYSTIPSPLQEGRFYNGRTIGTSHVLPSSSFQSSGMNPCNPRAPESMNGIGGVSEAAPTGFMVLLPPPMLPVPPPMSPSPIPSGAPQAQAVQIITGRIGTVNGTSILCPNLSGSFRGQGNVHSPP